jgi:hypothetical protein
VFRPALGSTQPLIQGVPGAISRVIRPEREDDYSPLSSAEVKNGGAIPPLPHMSSCHLFPVAPTLEHKASVKRFVSLQFLNPKTVGRTSWMGDQPVARPLHIQTQNKHRQTFMPWVGFETTTPVFERAKTVHALDRAATVTGSSCPGTCLIKHQKNVAFFFIFTVSSDPEISGYYFN